jgi:nucleoside-diphosphate-sugar epimerase
VNVAIVGRGLIGRLVEAAAKAAGHAARDVSPFRVAGTYRAGVTIDEAADVWLAAHGSERSRLTRELEGVDAVVNAAGLAEPESADVARLFDANVVLPAAVASVAADAGVRRLVHISSAAVQGRRDPLDETEEVEPLTPYGRSKADAERYLLAAPDRVPAEVLVYRPTSVQEVGRATTTSLIAFASRKRVPLAGRGDAPLPVCLSENVAAGVVYALGITPCPRIVLQPSEGMTARRLIEAFGDDPTIVSIPTWAVALAVRSGVLVGRGAPALAARVRRVELLALGQSQRARVLADAGFVVPSGVDGYRLLAEEARR